jgi:hypothetical protein
LCFAIIIFSNPVTYYFSYSIHLIPADSIAHFLFADNLFKNGLLYIPSWGHVDTSLILPPLFPFLIGLVNLLADGTLKASEWVNATCLLLVSVSLYLYLKGMAGRVAAVMAVVVLQLNYYYTYFAFVPLSEATFALTLCFALLVLLRLHKHAYYSSSLSLALGLCAALVFFSRQIGLFMYVFLMIWVMSQLLARPVEQRAALAKSLALISAGWFVLTVPYALVLHQQTGQSPMQQWFRSYEYVVRTDDPKVTAEIMKLNDLPTASYNDAYQKQRLLRALLPDGSEMLSKVVLVDAGSQLDEDNSAVSQALAALVNPSVYFRRLYRNFASINGVVGDILLYLFLASWVTPFVARSQDVSASTRLILPACIIFYLLSLSLVTGIVIRYVYIIFPFVIAHVACELFFCLNKWRGKSPIAIAAIALFFFGLAIASTPKYSPERKFWPKAPIERTMLGTFRDHVQPAEPVFSVTPFLSYGAGGTYRILPNDSLAKVVAYGKKTGVRWILISKMRGHLEEIKFYNQASWYLGTSLEADYPELVRLCCSIGGAFFLYEIIQ